MKNDPILLRLPEAAIRLGLSRSATYKLVMSGSLSSILIGRSRRIPVQAVDDWVADRIAEQADDQRPAGVGVWSKS